MTARTAMLLAACQGFAAFGVGGCLSNSHPAGAPPGDSTRGTAGEAQPAPDDGGASAPDPTDGGPGPQMPAGDASTKVSVLTRNYDSQRTGTNARESQLFPATITTSHFGRLFQLSVDDEVYAQPLYHADLTVGGQRHDVLFVATSSNTIYAFDANAPGPPLWRRSFNGRGEPGSKNDVGQGCKPYLDFTGHIGVVGTPVIDGATATMYFVTRTTENLSIVQRLHAIDIATGNERPGSPREITASVRGLGDDGGGTLLFNSKTQNQRAALGLSRGAVYVAWASFCDTGLFHGWAMAFDATSLATVGVANLTPDGKQGGIWMGGGGPVFDNDGNTYLVTGNGTFDGKTNFGQSLLKLAPRTLRPLDFFTPFNAEALNGFDLDFGSAGPSLLPGTTLLVAGSKEGKVYLLDSGNLGRQRPDDRQIPQMLPAIDATVRPRGTHHLHGSNVVWNGPTGLNLYVWGENDFLRAFHFDAGRRAFVMPAQAVSTILLPPGMPGGMMTLSSNGAQAGTGIVWVTGPRIGDANQATVPGRLRAFDAEDLRLLWDSGNAPSDDMLTLAKFNPPVVANGKVYVPSFSKVVSVYGLRPPVDRPAGTLSGGDVTSLQNPAAHRCLDVAAAGDPLGLADCTGAGEQVWLLTSGDDGLWELRRNATSLCLTAAQEIAGQALPLAPCDKSPAQRFALDGGAGTLSIRTAASGLCVDVSARAGDAARAAVLSSCDGSDGQSFASAPPRLRNYSADLCVDAPTPPPDDVPSLLRIWTCNGSPAQIWQTDSNGDGTVTIRRGSTGYCLAGPPPEIAVPGQAIAQLMCDGSPGQAWADEPISGGSQLRLSGTALCIDVPNSSSLAGTSMQLWPCNHSDAQRFGY